MSLNSCSEKNHGMSPDHFEYDVSFLPSSHVWFHLLKCKNCFVDYENTISMTKCAMYMILNYNPLLCLRWPLIWIDCFSIKESRDAIISVLFGKGVIFNIKNYIYSWMNEVLFSEMKSPPVHLKVVLIYFIQDFFFSWLNGENCCRQERCISVMCTYWKKLMLNN